MNKNISLLVVFICGCVSREEIDLYYDHEVESGVLVGYQEDSSIAPVINVVNPYASQSYTEIWNHNNYAEEARNWEIRYGLDDGWAEWMILNHERYMNAYVFSRSSDKNINVSFRWWENVPEIYDPPYADDEEYLETIETIAELQFPGWNFNFVRDLPDEESDVIVYSNDDRAFCCVSERDNIIHLRVGWGFAHEFGHFLGFHGHHCNSIETIGMGENMPPGTSECLFDGATDIEWCSAHRFAFDIPPDIENSEELYFLIGDMMDRHMG